MKLGKNKERNHLNYKQTILPLITAFIWGTAFVAQDVAAAHLGPFAFNAVRGYIAFIFLFLVIIIVNLVKRRKGTLKSSESVMKDKKGRRDLILSSLICGSLFAIANILQQSGIGEMGAGKASFITALYVVLVPLFGFFIGKKVTGKVWVSVLISVFGLYFLCMKPGNFSLERSDFLVMICAVGYSIQILTVDHFKDRVDGLYLSCGQSLVSATLAMFGTVAFETFHMSMVSVCVGPLLWTGVLSSGVACTCQILSQEEGEPVITTLLLSLESVFATIFGAIILSEHLNNRELTGCLLLFSAVILSQLPIEKLIKKKKILPEKEQIISAEE